VRPRRVAGAMLVLGVAIAALPGSPRAQGSPDTVSMRFGWEPGLTLRVTTMRSRTRSTTTSETRKSTSHYTLRVEESGEHLRVRLTDPEFETGGPEAGAAPAEQARVMEELAGLMPDFVVTRQGEFVRLHDLSGYQKRLGEFLVEMMPADMDAALATRIQAMLTSEHFLNSRVAEEWNAIVGAWVGGAFEIGTPPEYSQNEALGVFPGEEVKMNYAFAAEEVSLCKRGGVARACAELSMRSVADPEDVKRLIANILAKLAPGEMPTAPPFRTLEVENLLRVTTEPSGLFPHAYSLTKTIRGTLDTPDGLQPFEQIETTQVQYTQP